MLRASSHLLSLSSEAFVIEKEGEMPEGAIQPTRDSQFASTPSSGLHAAPVRLSSFPEYEVPSEVQVETIKVVRTKKKGQSKKKRTTPVDDVS